MTESLLSLRKDEAKAILGLLKSECSSCMNREEECCWCLYEEENENQRYNKYAS